MADDLKSKIADAEKNLENANAALLEAVGKQILNSSSKDVARAADAAAEAVAAAMKKVTALKEALGQQMGISGGRRKHKARGTKRRRHSGGVLGLEKILPASVATWLGLPPPPPPAPKLTPKNPGINGGKSGKKRKHSRRKY